MSLYTAVMTFALIMDDRNSCISINQNFAKRSRNRTKNPENRLAFVLCSKELSAVIDLYQITPIKNIKSLFKVLIILGVK